MKVLVLGGSGYIGSVLCARLAKCGWAEPVNASYRRTVSGVENLRIDTTRADVLCEALCDFDAVVNCVAGSRRSIADGARALVDACLAAGCERIVHLSSMAVYGAREGAVSEQAAFDSPFNSPLDWYARAKCRAEQHLAAFAGAGGTAVILRPGCVWGPGSQLWVGRIGRYLRLRRLGDLGAGGDGWSNLVHVDDVCGSVMAALQMAMPSAEVRVYNLAAPDSPRWNEYFVDLALAIGATPVRRISPMQLHADAWLGGPALKLAQSALALTSTLAPTFTHSGARARWLPDPLPPGLVRLWDRHQQLQCAKAQDELGLSWTRYPDGLRQSAQWFLRAEGHVQ